MNKTYSHIIITDIGSTTTKALLIQKNNSSFRFVDYQVASTTVERPYEDVKIGIYDSIKQLEARHNITILTEFSSPTKLEFAEDILYLTTSSAGGGLQILVIGLLKADSTSSAERAAYGVGGVIIESLAINDKHTMQEKLQILNKSHPDIILFCGGTDGGATHNVYRLAEMIKLGNITQKFSESSHVPLVFAGNHDTTDYINKVFSEKFDLHIVPNVKPSLETENLEPAKEKIHELFLNNVMEQAPGYSQIKKIVNFDILPTPSAVLRTIKLLGMQFGNVIAFDIGGATTDVYTNLEGAFNRSVSGNFGMSYSIGNVLSESDFKADIEQYLLHYSIDKDYFFNYVGNKILYPTTNPANDTDQYIEHVLAIASIRMSMKQHIFMHYQTRNKTFFDRLKESTALGIITQNLSDVHYFRRKLFKLNDIDIIIAAGGVITHATREQAIFIMIESTKPKEITQLWRDKHFISPHIGVLSEIDVNIAKNLLFNDCLEQLAVYINPQTVSTLLINEKKVKLNSNDVFCYINAEPVKIVWKSTEMVLNANTHLIVDTRKINKKSSLQKLLNALKPYNLAITTISKASIDTSTVNEAPQNHEINLRLPYTGTVHVKVNDDVKPETVIGENKYDIPKTYIVILSTLLNRNLSENETITGITVKINDTVNIDDIIFQTDEVKYFIREEIIKNNEIKAIERPLTEAEKLSGLSKNYMKYLKIGQGVYKLGKNKFFVHSLKSAFSPVKGIVKHIDYTTGTIILQEIQDYCTEPFNINLAEKLGVNANEILGYMKKNINEMIYEGETLALKTQVKESVDAVEEMMRKLGQRTMEEMIKKDLENYKRIKSPKTGFIKEIDAKTGFVTICYDKKPFKTLALCYGKVTSVTNNQEIYINITALKIDGKIGFGKDSAGTIGNEIIYKNHVKYNDLTSFKDINGLICNTISYSCLKKYLGKDIGVALTGNETLPFSLIILNGFSSEPVLEDYDVFQKNTDQHILMKPFTQIRAGAVRPCLYIMKKCE